MNVVIYSADLQPITVVSLDINQYQQACKWDDFLLQNKNANGQTLRIKVHALKIKAPVVGDERKVTRTVFTRTKPQCPATPLYTATVEGDDTKRLDWMETGGSDQLFNLGTTWYARAGYGQPHRRHKYLRAAIDAAMAAQKENK